MFSTRFAKPFYYLSLIIAVIGLLVWGSALIRPWGDAVTEQGAIRDKGSYVPNMDRDAIAQAATKKDTNGEKRSVTGKKILTSEAKTKLQEVYNNLPIVFEPNDGHLDSQVKFVARGKGYGFFLTKNEAIFTLSNKKQQTRVGMQIVGSNPDSLVSGMERLKSTSNYFIGNDQAQWRTNVTNYNKVRYIDVYPGVDMIYYGNNQRLEYDFIVAPGKDPKQIELAFRGTNKIDINKKGELVLKVNGGELVQKSPVIYQEENGTRNMIAGHYVKRGQNRIGFEVADYNENQPLVIDPQLVYSTYLGGTNSEFAGDVAVDNIGQAFITGSTSSLDFPVLNAFQASQSGFSNDVFVAKFSLNGSLLYSTYLGGSEDDTGYGIDIDTAGNAYVVGTTGFVPLRQPSSYASNSKQINVKSDVVNRRTTAERKEAWLAHLNGNSGIDTRNSKLNPQTQFNNFPVTAGVFMPTAASGSSTDGFVSKIGANGNTLVYSTYLGGTDNDSVDTVRVVNGLAYVAGSTSSSDFPVTNNAFQTGNPSFTSGFITKFNTGATALTYSTYLGASSGATVINSIDVDGSSNAYVTGFTSSSTGFPLMNPLQTANTGFNTDGFITQLNATGTNILFSTYFGGGGQDIATSVKFVPGTPNVLYVAGYTSSFDFIGISPNAAQSFYGGGSFDGFVSKLSVTGTPSIIYGTYVGGSGDDEIYSMDVNSTGNAYAVGYTDSFDLPVVAAFQSFNNGGADAFAAKLDPKGTVFNYLTYLGGSDLDFANAAALAPNSNLFILGNTQSFNFPIANAFQSSLATSGRGNNQDAFLTVLNNVTPTASLFVSPSSLNFIAKPGTTSAAQNVTIRNNGTAPLCVNNVFVACPGGGGQGPPALQPKEGSGCPFFITNNSCFGEGGSCLDPGEFCTVSVAFSPDTAGPMSANLIINTDSGTSTIPLTGDQQGQDSISFTNATYTTTEGSVATISMVRTGSLVGDVTVSFTAVDDTGVASEDYVTSDATVTFRDGETGIQSVSIPIIDDDKVEGTERISLLLFNASSGISLGQSFATLIINDNDVAKPGRVQFSQSVYSVSESDGNAHITVNRTNGNNVPVSVNYTVSGGSATEGQDFVAQSGILNFGVGIDSQSFSVRILNDKDDEPSETINLLLASATGGVVISAGQATINIVDDDVAPAKGVLQVAPQADFGSVNIGSTNRQTININNVGTAPLNLSNPVIVAGGLFTIPTPLPNLVVPPNGSVPLTVIFQPNPGSLGSVQGSLVIVSDGGTATVNLKGLSVDTVPPDIKIISPNGGEILQAGSTFNINFAGSDNDLLTTYTVSFVAADGNTLAGNASGDIARLDGKAVGVSWKVPPTLETSLGRIVLKGTDRAGNISTFNSGLFSVRMPLTSSPIVRTVVSFTPPPANQVAPPTNVTADAREVRNPVTNPTVTPALQVAISFDPPPQGQIAPPQNVKVVAQELKPGNLTNLTNVAARPFNLLRSLTNVGPTDVVGYNIYRVPEPQNGVQPPPEVVVKPENLVATVDANTTTFTDKVSTNQSSNYSYSVTAFFGNGMMSMGSNPAGTDLPVIKNPVFRNGTIFFDAAGSFIKDTGAQLIVNDTDIYPIQFDDSGTLLTVLKRSASQGSGLIFKKLVKKNTTVKLVAKNPDGKISVAVSFSRGANGITKPKIFSKPNGTLANVLNPQVDGPQLLGYNIYRVDEPLPGSPMPTPDQIVQPQNLVGSIPAGMTSFTDTATIGQSSTGNFAYSVTAFFGNGMMSTGSTPAAGTDLPVIKNPAFVNNTILIDAAASFIAPTGAVLIINDAESFPLRFDDSGTRLTVDSKANSTPGGQAIKKLIVKGTPVLLTVRNPDGKVSVGVMFTR